MPILTIRLELIDNRVAFRPPLDTHTSVISVQELVHQWLDSFLARGKLVKMLGPKVNIFLITSKYFFIWCIIYFVVIMKKKRNNVELKHDWYLKLAYD